jgi:choice-of-anchor A domain-containing protein
VARSSFSGLKGQNTVLGPNVGLVLPNDLSRAENLLFNYTDNANPGLTVYVGGTSASISGNQYIKLLGVADSLLIYCAPTVTSFTLNGNGQFTGVLVAPNADLAMHGGGNSDEDFCGSLLVNSAGMNGHFHFHWDESLGKMKSGNSSRWRAKSWNEIP